MFLISVKDCFKKRFLTKTTPSLDLAEKSLRQARFFLGQGEDMIKLDKKEMGVIALYNSFFHTARALLFRDGVKERSHFCIARYIEEMYVEKRLINQKFLDHLDVLRDMRHEAQYTVEPITIDEDLNRISEICEKFIGVVEKMITEKFSS